MRTADTFVIPYNSDGHWIPFEVRNMFKGYEHVGTMRLTISDYDSGVRFGISRDVFVAALVQFVNLYKRLELNCEVSHAPRSF
jgi:hypothetical protein